jgi:hypothetical protein
MSDFPITYLLDRQTATTAVCAPFQVLGSGKRDVTLTFTSEGTTSGGTILLEETDLPAYTGTWSQLYSQAASGFTGSVKLCVHIELGAGMWIRARISSTVTGGGTATVTIVNI